jgi:senataxin
MPNDLVVLVPNKSKEFVESLLNGLAVMDNTIDTSSLRKHAMVGQAEYRRDTVDGLLVRVGKKWWATLGHQSDMMWLLKLGTNVMAVRGFTALCRVEQLPLKRFILGQHLVDETHSKHHSLGQDTEKMLVNMGGTNALGKGFIHYVERKFNPS